MNHSLKTILDRLYQARSRKHLANDPLSFCHNYPDPADREVAGLIASSFAYGNVKIILRNVAAILNELGSRPSISIRHSDPASDSRRFAGFKHRFNDSRDLCALLQAIRWMLEDSGSIDAFFRQGLRPGDPDVGSAINRFSSSVLNRDYSAVFGAREIPADAYFRFLFPSPAGGSACKRICMFLRWMVRPDDGIDLGLWREVSPSLLVIPVDAHILRIGRFLGLTTRRQGDWKTALEITGALRSYDPDDPVKYDFSLCHLGISEGCGKKGRSACLTCDIAGICKGNSTLFAATDD